MCLQVANSIGGHPTNNPISNDLYSEMDELCALGALAAKSGWVTRFNDNTRAGAHASNTAAFF